MSRLALPLPELKRYDARNLGPDVSSALTVLFLCVPQGLAYATIAGLPPAMGLYAASVPAIIGSLLRSSRHVVAGPTNALSLLIGGATAVGLGGDPTAVALTLALMAGLFQIGTGLLRLGVVIDYISTAVVQGYITGAAVLIAVGQLHNATGTEGASGRIWVTLGGWLPELSRSNLYTVGVTAGTVAMIIGFRRLAIRMRRPVPGQLIALALGAAAVYALGLDAHGVLTVANLAPIPSGFPPLTVPSLANADVLLPLAIACAVLSLVESNAVARSIASRTGDKIDSSTELVGQGLANVAAAFCGGYPVSGSLSRSALNERSGARTRFAGALSGLLMVVVLVALGPVLGHTPIASLAGLLFIVAWDLVDTEQLRRTIRASKSDGLALVTTMVGTWVLPLDYAIYLGVGVSLALVLRKARFLSVHELQVEDGELREAPVGETPGAADRCERVRVLDVEGSLFFGTAGELSNALDAAVVDRRGQVLVLRLRHTRGLDSTTAATLESLAVRLRADGRHLLLVGMDADTMRVLDRSGAADVIGRENIYPARKLWFQAFADAHRRALTLCGGACDHCPLATIRFRAAPPDADPDPER